MNIRVCDKCTKEIKDGEEYYQPNLYLDTNHYKGDYLKVQHVDLCNACGTTLFELLSSFLKDVKKATINKAHVHQKTTAL